MNVKFSGGPLNGQEKFVPYVQPKRGVTWKYVYESRMAIGAYDTTNVHHLYSINAGVGLYVESKFDYMDLTRLAKEKGNNP